MWKFTRADLPLLLFLLSLAVLIPLLACKEPHPLHSLDGNWRLMMFEDMISQQTFMEPDHIPRSIVLEFSDNGKKGNIQGHTVTNTVWGSYELQPGRSMQVLDFGGTKKGEPQWANHFWEAIHQVNAYERSEKNMYLYFRADSARMVFVRE